MEEDGSSSIISTRPPRVPVPVFCSECEEMHFDPCPHWVVQTHATLIKFKTVSKSVVLISIVVTAGAVIFCIYDLIIRPPTFAVVGSDPKDAVIVGQFSRLAIISQFSYFSLVSQFSVCSIVSMFSMCTIVSIWSLIGVFSTMTVIDLLSCNKYLWSRTKRWN